MRKLMLPLALVGAAALTGCVGYGGTTVGSGVYYGNGSPYYSGSGYYGSYGSSPYYGSSAGVVISNQPYSYPYRTYDRRDRDGDGVPNWRDARPDDPRRY